MLNEQGVFLAAVLTAPPLIAYSSPGRGPFSLASHVVLMVLTPFAYLTARSMAIEQGFSPNVALWIPISLLYTFSMTLVMFMLKFHDIQCDDKGDEGLDVETLVGCTEKQRLACTDKHPLTRTARSPSLKFDAVYWVLAMISTAVAHMYLAHMSNVSLWMDVEAIIDLTQWSIIPVALLLGMCLWSLELYHRALLTSGGGAYCEPIGDVMEVACAEFVVQRVLSHRHARPQKSPSHQWNIIIFVAHFWDWISRALPVLSFVGMCLTWIDFGGCPFAPQTPAAVTSLIAATLVNAFVNILMFVGTTINQWNALDAWWVWYWLGQIVLTRACELGLVSWTVAAPPAILVSAVSVGAGTILAMLLASVVTCSLLSRG